MIVARFIGHLKTFGTTLVLFLCNCIRLVVLFTMKATLKGIYDIDKSAGAGATVAVNAGDVKLSASVTTYMHSPTLTSFALAVEKPDYFIVHYDVPKKDFGFKFMNSLRVREKPLNLTYEHSRGENKTILRGTFEFVPANKVSVNYTFDSRVCKLKYIYTHKGLTTVEPTYDVSKNAWDFAISRRVYDNDTLKASYETSNNVLGLEWAWDSKNTGSLTRFKISASVTLTEELKALKLGAETTWNLDM